MAVGGKPTMPADLPGVEHCISSDGFFLLDEMPENALVVGAGYIAVEMAGILHALGCDTDLAVRGAKPLRSFDDLMSDTLVSEMARQGLTLQAETTLAKVELTADGKKKVSTTDGRVLGEYSEVLLAVGREPLTGPLDLQHAGVDLDANGRYIAVDEYLFAARTRVSDESRRRRGRGCGYSAETELPRHEPRRRRDPVSADYPRRGRVRRRDPSRNIRVPAARGAATVSPEHPRSSRGVAT